MYALRESYPEINSIRRELTMLIGVIMMFIFVANCVVIFSNTHIIHTSNKPIWMYDLFAILFWLINVCCWLATYWDIVNDNQVIHLLFFTTPFILSIWGTVVVSNIKEVIVKSLWNLFLVSYISSIVVSTLFIFFILQEELKRIREEKLQGIDTDEHNGVIRGTYKLMTNSGEIMSNKQPPYIKQSGSPLLQNTGYTQVQHGGYSPVPTQHDVDIYF